MRFLFLGLGGLVLGMVASVAVAAPNTVVVELSNNAQVEMDCGADQVSVMSDLVSGDVSGLDPDDPFIVKNAVDRNPDFKHVEGSSTSDGSSTSFEIMAGSGRASFVATANSDGVITEVMRCKNGPTIDEVFPIDELVKKWIENGEAYINEDGVVTDG